jgi:hypothetical protein
MTKITIKATLIGSTSPKDIVIATWDGRNWTGDAAFTSSSTEQQIIDEQWAWVQLGEALDEGHKYGEFEIADSGTWRWTIEDVDGAPFMPSATEQQPGLSVGELQREDARTQLLQRIAYQCTGSGQTETAFRQSVRREYPDLKLGRDEWARVLRFRDGVIERMGR